MLRVGLTGGIGSGKTTVAELFAIRGVPIVDTDLLAREVVRPGEPALNEIVRVFGKEVLEPNGALDRAKLRQRVFDNPNARRELEAILHPRIRAALLATLQSLRAPYCIVVVPLLVETGFSELIDRVLVVDTDTQHQLTRTSERDKVSTESVQKILEVQATREKRLKHADDVIINNGTRTDLEREVERLHTRYLALATSPGER